MSAISTGMFVVFVIVLTALVLFVLEPVPIDVTAIGIMVALMVLRPWTGISPSEGVSGFANAATITILAMMILSGGVRRTGLIKRMGETVASYTGSDARKQLASTIGIVGPLSGVINNTAAVAILLPMVSDLAHENDTSPSKLLIPLSYASMAGGMLTLIGTSTNLLASGVSERLLGESYAFSIFEFTHLGIVVFIVTGIYLLTIGYWLAPARVPPRNQRETTDAEEFLTEAVINAESEFVGSTIGDAFAPFDIEVVQLVRDEETHPQPPSSTIIEGNDILLVRLTTDTLQTLHDAESVELLPEATPEEAESLSAGETLAEIVVTAGSDLVGETIESARFQDQYQTAVLAVRRGDEQVHERLESHTLRPGDLILIEAEAETIDRLADDPDVIVAGEIESQRFRTSKLPLAVAVVLGVISLAALDFLPVMVAALAGVVVMIVGGVLKPAEAYDAVEWDVIFLLAGVIPLGRALSETGGAALLGSLVVSTADILPTIGVLGLFYLLTAVMTNLISNQASVVLLIPVAVDAAQQLGANAFAFVLVVTFAASTAFMSPVGYQTNLFVYGPGGYEFSDFIRVGAPLQLLLAVVTTLGIAAFWWV